MDTLHCRHLTSVEQLRAAADAWDDLWRRSDVALPIVRAEPLAQWIEHFSPRGAFHALVVAGGQQWVAALPLVPCRLGRLIPAGGLPTNPWSPCGELLLDQASNVEAAMDSLLAGAGELSWPLLWMNEAVPETPRWQMSTACSASTISRRISMLPGAAIFGVSMERRGRMPSANSTAKMCRATRGSWPHCSPRH